jgi:hypothetical protein
MKTHRKLPALLLAAALCLLLCATASAAERENPENKTGSITIYMKDVDAGKDVPGGKLRLYRVATPARNDGNDFWVLTDAFAGSNVTLDDIGAADMASKLADYAKDHKLSGTDATVGQDAKLQLTELPSGLYLVVQVTPASGYNPITPFLVSIPTVQDGQYVYDVDASPKLELKKAPPTPTPPPPSPSEKLPQTGQLWWPVLLLSITGTALVCVGIAKNRRSRTK